MIITNIFKCGKNKFFRSVLYILMFTFTFTTCACYTTYDGKLSPQQLHSRSNFVFIEAIMKDGLVINLRDKDARYESIYDAIVYTSYNDDTSWVNPKVYNRTSTVNTIKIKDVKALIVEKEEQNTGLTILAVLGIVAGLILIAGIIIAASKESCPFIYSFNGDKYIFDAEPYGGAIAEGLKRTDYSRLEDLKDVNGKYKLLMRNEADETQHTDEIKLLVIEHPEGTEIAPDVSGKFSVFEKAILPLSVTDENGKDISIFFNKKDNVQWQTDMPDQTGFDARKLRHELILKFPKPKDAKKVKLLVNAGTALWGGYMIKSMLNMRGNKVDEWYADINNKGPELIRLYNFMEREELYSLKVNVSENDKWMNRGLISAAGPFLDEDRIIELNIENVIGDTLIVKLNPPYGYWKFDYAGLIFESNAAAKISEIHLSYAMNEKGQDLRDSMFAVDGRYYSMPDSISTANLEFKVPPMNVNLNRSLYLKTTGYYDIHLKKNKPQQTELIEKIFETPGFILEISMNEYIEKIKSLSANNK